MKRKKELIVILSSLLVIVLSVSVAYFTTKILGTGKDISVTSADLKVIFTSGSGTINGTNIEPGWTSGENTFTVKNESNGTYKYNIIIKDLVNTFVTEGFLQYKITSADGGYNMSEFKDVPKSSTAKDAILAYSVEIAKGKTHSYSVEFKYLNSETESQNEDMGKTLSGTLYIEKGTTEPFILAETIKTHATSHTNGVYNENGYRYEGTDPSNYIYMTNKSTNEKELWRIIGVFNDGANGEEVIRVRRHYEKDNYPGMAYDENNTNHFPNTTMYSTLSSTYNLTNYNHTVNYMMYLGTSNTSESLTSSGLYTMERGETPGVTAATNYSNAVRFTGSVGLMYPSDYGYAVLASDCARSILAIEYNETETCYNNNWLFQGNNKYQWLISPSTFDDFVTFNVNSNGLVYGIYSGDYDAYGGSVRYDFAYSPVMALSNNVLVSGSGTKTDPYEIIN